MYSVASMILLQLLIFLCWININPFQNRAPHVQQARLLVRWLAIEWNSFHLTFAPPFRIAKDGTISLLPVTAASASLQPATSPVGVIHPDRECPKAWSYIREILEVVAVTVSVAESAVPIRPFQLCATDPRLRKIFLGDPRRRLSRANPLKAPRRIWTESPAKTTEVRWAKLVVLWIVKFTVLTRIACLRLNCKMNLTRRRMTVAYVSVVQRV